MPPSPVVMVFEPWKLKMAMSPKVPAFRPLASEPIASAASSMTAMRFLVAMAWMAS